MGNINEQKNKNEEKKRNTPLFILKIIGNVLFYLVILTLFLFALANIRGGKDNIPNLFGRGFLSVQTSSMQRDPNKQQREEWTKYEIGGINQGDLVLVKTFSGTVNDLKVGDVVTWYDSSIGNQGGLNTHRIVYINVEQNYVIAQGDRVAQTSPYDTNDPASIYNQSLEATGAIQNVSVKSILGVTTGVWGGAGKVLDNMQKNWLWYFVVPIAVLLLVELFFVFKNIIDYRNEKKKLAEGEANQEELRKEVEAEREKLRQEILAELKAQGAINSNIAEVSAEETKPEEVVVASVTEEPVAEEKPEVLEEEPVEEPVQEETIEEEIVAEEPVVEAEEEADVASVISDIQDEKDALVVAKEIEKIETKKAQAETEKALKKAQAKKPAKKNAAKTTKAEPKAKAEKEVKEEAKPAGRKKAGEDSKPSSRAKAGEKTTKPAGRAKAGSKTTSSRAKAGSKAKK